MKTTFRFNKHLGRVEKIGRDDSKQAKQHGFYGKSIVEQLLESQTSRSEDAFVVVSVSVSVSVYINSGVVEESSGTAKGSLFEVNKYGVDFKDYRGNPVGLLTDSLSNAWGEGIMTARGFEQYPMKLGF